MNNIFLATGISCLISLILSPFVISFMKKKQAKQSILHYVEAHKSKEGTPTLGGLIFLISTLLTCCLFFGQDCHLAVVSLVVTLGFGLLGFLDDFLKIKYKQNLGLKAYQKALGQFGLAVLASIFAYKNNLVGSEIYIPFFDIYLDLGIWFVPFAIFVFLAITNSVNLTDGLDGLAGSTSVVFLIFFGILLVVNQQALIDEGTSILVQHENHNIIILNFACLGGILGFLIFNSHPAKIFMGDTGSLAIGGLVSSITLFTKNVLFVPLLFTVIVLSSVSVIIQVLHFKRTKKRVFLMAPFHHHLEKKGWYETKIVAVYIIITILIDSLVLAFVL